MNATSRKGSCRFRRIIKPFELSGVGLHSGRECRLRVSPPVGVSPGAGTLSLAAEGAELPICQLALEGTGRGSDYIFPDGRRIRTCEHVLAALTGMGVWEARLEVEGGEMPALDGCAERTVREILACSEPCEEGPTSLALSGSFSVGTEERFVAAFPAPELHITYVVSYNASVIGTQMLDFTANPQDFQEQIARARTFAMAAEIEALRAHGMALGGTLENAILVGDTGVQAAGGLRWPDEFVRHKTLDLIGDLAALGRPLRAHVVAVRAGHELHLKFAERLRRLCEIGHP